jgi:hypothetical protein
LRIGFTEARTLKIRNADALAARSLDEEIAVFPNTAAWYSNASFLLPLAATVCVAGVGAVRRDVAFLGFAAFLAVVTLLMVPVVLAGWRHTPTAVVLTRSRLVTLHDGRELRTLLWSDVCQVRQRETQGNVRWEIVGEGSESIFLDGEIDDLARVVTLSRDLAGLHNR